MAAVDFNMRINASRVTRLFKFLTLRPLAHNICSLIHDDHFWLFVQYIGNFAQRNLDWRSLTHTYNQRKHWLNVSMSLALISYWRKPTIRFLQGKKDHLLTKGQINLNYLLLLVTWTRSSNGFCARIVYKRKIYGYHLVHQALFGYRMISETSVFVNNIELC